MQQVHDAAAAWTALFSDFDHSLPIQSTTGVVQPLRRESSPNQEGEIKQDGEIKMWDLTQTPHTSERGKHNMGGHPTPRALILAGVLLMLACGLIHLIGAPEHLQEATYIGVLFVINAAGALVAALGIYRDRLWGWLLGVLVAGGAFVMFMVSRLIGLPAYREHIGMWLGDSTGDRLGIPSLIVEATLVALSLIVLARRAREESR
jgi:hypothetical protein